MDESVSRRGVFRKFLSGGVDAVVRIFKEDPLPDASELHSDAVMSPEQAGHLLRFRKTTKSNSGLHLHRHSKREPSVKAHDL